MNSDRVLFLMYIMNGYSFRNTISIIKSETEHATMLISPGTIEISFLNTSKCGVHRILLNTKEFNEYRYDIRDEEGNLVPFFPIAFNTNEMFSTTKGIGRKDGIRIYWMEGENRISIQPIKDSSKNPGQASALFVSIVPMEHKRYDISEYDPDPNVKVAAKDFAEICSQANTLKCTSVELTCKRSSIIIKSIKPNQKVASIHRFEAQVNVATRDSFLPSNVKEIDKILENINLNEQGSNNVKLRVADNDEISDIKIPISTAKALSKIHNLSSNGTQLRFYFYEKKPIKIESPIGNYGSYTICIR